MNCSISITSREWVGVAFAVLSKAAFHALPGRIKRSKAEDGRTSVRSLRLCLQVLRKETEAQVLFLDRNDETAGSEAAVGCFEMIYNFYITSNISRPTTSFRTAVSAAFERSNSDYFHNDRDASAGGSGLRLQRCPRLWPVQTDLVVEGNGGPNKLYVLLVRRWSEH